MRRAPSRSLRLALAVVVAVVASSPSLSRADDKKIAKELFEQGLEKMEAKRYDEACPAIEKSLALDPYPGTLFTLADCEALRHHAAAALQRYTEYLALYATLPKAKQAKQGNRERDARAKKAELERTVARVTFTLPAGAPSDVTITTDGSPLASDRIGVEILLDPGDHVVTIEPRGGQVKEQRFTLEKGEKREIALDVSAPVASSTATTTAPPPPPPSQGPSGQRIAAYVSGGVGLAGIVVGAVTGGLMLAQKGAIDAGCKDSPSGVTLCDAKGAAAGNDAKLFGAVASAGFVAGIAGAGLSVVLFVTEKKKPKTGAATGGFQVGVQPRGPFGATVGVRGSF